ncbi:unnamed protein product [Blepharisma stoltei]|uniref:Uncharacterized protein n=1 Tax=Blepharisma stoltei TaxID=1481888 RepID=A0AAU9IWV2_9CILI|nr:unnamed protein product [Blepharisma stoltei]
MSLVISHLNITGKKLQHRLSLKSNKLKKSFNSLSTNNSPLPLCSHNHGSLQNSPKTVINSPEKTENKIQKKWKATESHTYKHEKLLPAKLEMFLKDNMNKPRQEWNEKSLKNSRKMIRLKRKTSDLTGSKLRKQLSIPERSDTINELSVTKPKLSNWEFYPANSNQATSKNTIIPSKDTFYKTHSSTENSLLCTSNSIYSPLNEIKCLQASTSLNVLASEDPKSNISDIEKILEDNSWIIKKKKSIASSPVNPQITTKTIDSAKDETISFPTIRKLYHHQSTNMRPELRQSMTSVYPKFEMSPFGHHKSLKEFDDIKSSFMNLNSEETTEIRRIKSKRYKQTRKITRSASPNDYKFMSLYIEWYEKNLIN